MLPLVLALLGFASSPEELRGDGDLVFGCSSASRLSSAVSVLPPDMAATVQRSVGQLGRFGLDPKGAIWTVAIRRSGRLLPTQVRFEVEDGITVPAALVAMLPGSPKVRQNGRYVNLMIGGAPKQEDPGLVGLAESSLDGVPGCVVAAKGAAGAGLSSLAIRPDGGMSLLLEAGDEGWTAPDEVGKLPVLTKPTWEALATGVGSPEAATRAAWGSTTDTPDFVVRFNIDLPEQALLGAAVPQATQSRAVRRLRIEPGAELGLFLPEQDEKTEFGAVIPIDRPRTVRWWPGRIEKALRRDGAKRVKEGKAFYIALSPEQSAWVTAKKRRLIVASTAAIANDLRDPKVGVSWTDGGMEEPGVRLGALSFSGTMSASANRVKVELSPRDQEPQP